MASPGYPSSGSDRHTDWKWISWLCSATLALALLVQGCSFNPVREAPGSDHEPVFLPPAQMVTAVEQNTPKPAVELLPTPTVPCEDNLTFVSDLTIPDGSEVQPGATLDKRWEVRNSGSCNWDERYSLRLTAGDQLGVHQQMALYPARSGAGFIIRINFQAPLAAGSYRSAWQAYDPAGYPFGDAIFIDIIVSD